MEPAYIKNVRNICNQSDYTLDSTNEEEFRAAIDDAETLITSIQENKRYYPGVDDFGTPGNTADDDGDVSPVINSYDPFANVKIDPGYSENNKKIKQSMEFLGAKDSDYIEDFDEEGGILIEKIESMRDTISMAGGNLKNIPEVTENDKLSDIKAVHKKLKRRHDQLLYAETGGQLIMGAAHALEGVFNGRRNLFGYRPNLEGWAEKYVRSKLGSLKQESANIVADKIESQGFSNMTSILVQLVPGAIIYATTTRHNSDGIRDGDVVNASDKLHK